MTLISSDAQSGPQAPALGLRLMLPRNPDIAVKRFLWVPYAIQRILMGNVVGAGFPDAVADALISSFVGGYHVTISLSGRPKRRQPDLERLAKHVECWVICFRKPEQQQWRLFGRFAGPNVFVGSKLHMRSELDPEIEYDRKAMEAMADWDVNMGNCGFVKSSKTVDYISKPHTDCDVPVL